jgi:hypothetical protein
MEMLDIFRALSISLNELSEPSGTSSWKGNVLKKSTKPTAEIMKV